MPRLLLLLAASLLAQPSPDLDPRLAKVPPALRERAVAALQTTDEAQRVLLVRDLAPATDFLLALLEQEPSARVRREIVTRLLRRDEPPVRQALERLIVSDPDASVSILALEQLRLLQSRANLTLFEQRLPAATAADRAPLAIEHERAVALARGARLPAFFQTPPPLFSLKPAGQPVRVLAFGDFGQGTPGQQRTAQAMLRFHESTSFDFAITLGDNFYPRGMESPSDPRWKTLWDELYDPLRIPFYVSFGNHDYGFPDSPAAELLYTHKSPTWRLPAVRYTYTAGPVQFFAIDSQAPSQAQWMWLEEELNRSPARWKIVYGHHPIYSAGQHGDTDYLVRDLLPILRNRADIYFAGHDHDLQHLQPEDGVHFFISGGGGAGIRPITPGPRSLFAQSSYGFAVVEAGQSTLKVSYYDPDLKPLYVYTLRK